MNKIIVLLFTVCYFCWTQPSVSQSGFSKSYDHGIVVSATEEASNAGVEMLKAGGNAVDAAIATQFALAVTLPAAGNLGGGGFMVLRLEDGTSTTLNFREKAPENASRDMYLDENGQATDQSRVGPLSVGVPGTVDGLLEAHKRYGTLPLSTLLAPAIDLAKNGFRISWLQARSFNNQREKFQVYPGSAHYFIPSDSSSFQEHDLFIQRDLAETLQRIVEQGREGFYAGITASLLIEELDRLGGIMTLNDLANYKSEWMDPLELSYKEYTLIMMPPPSSGGVALGQILSMIEPHWFVEFGWNSAEYIHLFSEVCRRVYADRAFYIGDPNFVSVPTSELLSKTYAMKRMESFSWSQATSSDQVSHGEIALKDESMETTHLSVVDQFGNAVSMTVTLNSSYGSKIAVTGAGFFLNNEMDDFSAKPGVPNQFGLLGGEANAVAPNKRMVSSMTPTIVTKNDSLSMVLGTPGGSTIITTVAQVFLNVAEFGMSIQHAVSAPRIHHQWIPDTIFFDAFGIRKADQLSLEAKGHTLLERKGTAGRADCIFIDAQGTLYGGADPRGDDHVAGY